MIDRKKLEDNGEFIELRVGPKWSYISITRQFIQNFLTISCGDQVKADKFSTSISELLENAVKYSIDSQPYLFVHVNNDNGQILGVVENSATTEAVESLREIYDSVMDGTPMEAYVRQMKEAAVREDGKSQLGLARIRFEAGAQLGLEISEDNKISLSVIL